jgi:hypothetical protein
MDIWPTLWQNYVSIIEIYFDPCELQLGGGGGGFFFGLFSTFFSSYFVNHIIFLGESFICSYHFKVELCNSYFCIMIFTTLKAYDI